MSKNAEEWRDIKDFEGIYQVSNTGKVKSLSRRLWNGVAYFESEERILKGTVDDVGYVVVVLKKQSKMRRERIHRLVAETFIPNPNNYRVVNHIDADKTNNNVNNLEWCTHKHNIQHANKMGSFDKSKKRIRVIETGIIYSSIHDCARDMKDYKVDYRHISDCIRGKLKSHAGFHYELIGD